MSALFKCPGELVGSPATRKLDLLDMDDWHDPAAPWEAIRQEWRLREGVTFLNHGSFGPSPRPVLEARRAWIERLESDPMDFFVRQQETHLRDALAALGSFVGTSSGNLVFLPNATSAMNVVARSLPLAPGDEVVCTAHEYGAVLRLWQRTCERAGARVVVQPIGEPIESSEQVVRDVMAGVTDRTRLLVFSHVTSATAMTLPAQALCRAARQAGVPVCIDGPHAIGMVDCELDQLDCDFYTASCHKWLSAPFGAGFLYVHPRAQQQIEPLVVSWGQPLAGGTGSWQDEFSWSGTGDPTPYLAVPAAIDFLQRVGLAAFRQRTHELAKYARERAAEISRRPALYPDDVAWYGSMVALPLEPQDLERLRRELWERYHIEVAWHEWNGAPLLRVSCHLYNTRDDVDRLFTALGELGA